MWYQENAFLLIIALVVIVSIQIAMAWKKGWTTNAVRITGITIVAFMAVFAALVVSKDQTIPAIFGVLGTIGGLLYGRKEENPDGNKSEDNDKPE